ncbi:MAG: translation initiation factor 2 [Sedimenticola sp.]
MTDVTPSADETTDAEVIDQQFLRAISSFEAIIISQIDIKNKLADRLNYSIRAGIIIIAAIAISIFILLLTLSSQLNSITHVVINMNQDFTSVSKQMNLMSGYITNMERQVSLLQEIDQQTGIMDKEMQGITKDMVVMEQNVGGIKQDIGSVRTNIANISSSIDYMNFEVQRMGVDMQRMGQPARSMNKMFPFFQ